MLSCGGVDSRSKAGVRTSLVPTASSCPRGWLADGDPSWGFTRVDDANSACGAGDSRSGVEGAPARSPNGERKRHPSGESRRGHTETQRGECINPEEQVVGCSGTKGAVVGC